MFKTQLFIVKILEIFLPQTNIMHYALIIPYFLDLKYISSVDWYIHPFIHPSIYTSLDCSIHPTIDWYIHPFIHPFIHLYIGNSSFHPSLDWNIHLSIHPSIIYAPTLFLCTLRLVIYPWIFTSGCPSIIYKYGWLFYIYTMVKLYLQMKFM